MVNLIERSLAAMEDHVIFLAPRDAVIPDAFQNYTFDSSNRQQLLHEMQRVRGSIYLEEGYAKRHELLTDGRYELPEDNETWHVLMTDPDGRIRSCMLYFDHPNTTTLSEMRVRHCTLANTKRSRATLQAAVEAEIERARLAGLRVAELGGWVIDKARRGSPDGLVMVLAMYSLARFLGGSIGIGTATVGNSSSSTLQQLGGSHLEFEGRPIPPYFDARYQTNMELLVFDSRCPNTRYADLIDLAMPRLVGAAVVADSAATIGVYEDLRKAVGGLTQHVA